MGRPGWGGQGGAAINGGDVLSATQKVDADRAYSREDYLRWCEAQPRGRFERVDGRIVAMAPERALQVRVKANVFVALRHATAAAGVACEALIDGLAMATGDNDYEPDAVVSCGHLPDDDMFASHPLVVVVLSFGTVAVATGRKLVGHFQVASIAHCLIVDPVR